MTRMTNLFLPLLLTTILLSTLSCNQKTQVKRKGLPLLKVAENKRFLVDENGNPFFWLGDTGWLLFSKLNRNEVETYLADRAEKGFNVIQVMALHSVAVTNVYNDSALIGQNVSTPLITEGIAFDDSAQYDYWDHVDFVIDKAAEKGIYIGMVPVWGNNVKGGRVTNDDAATYATFLANRYKNKSNIIWLNGGDVRGNDSINIWNTIGETVNRIDTNNLITFHPFGRTTSSMWFHNENWLDFNMFQSGHRRYDQDDSEWGFGQDNWKYVNHDYALNPVKPTIDGEPSYEGIPHGLHDTLQPYWNADDLRRYAYWSVFAGGFGFTYGANSVMQVHKPSDKNPSYGPKEYWDEGIHLPGSGQMQFLKELILSRPFFERVPNHLLIDNDQGTKYDYLASTSGKKYAFIYTYNGRTFTVQMGLLEGDIMKAAWFNPRNGETTKIGNFPNEGSLPFDPPGEKADGNDWVLVLDSSDK
jgi:hypothetical protein